MPDEGSSPQDSGAPSTPRHVVPNPVDPLSVAASAMGDAGAASRRSAPAPGSTPGVDPLALLRESMGEGPTVVQRAASAPPLPEELVDLARAADEPVPIRARRRGTFARRTDDSVSPAEPAEPSGSWEEVFEPGPSSSPQPAPAVPAAGTSSTSSLASDVTADWDDADLQATRWGSLGRDVEPTANPTEETAMSDPTTGAPQEPSSNTPSPADLLASYTAATRAEETPTKDDVERADEDAATPVVPQQPATKADQPASDLWDGPDTEPGESQSGGSGWLSRLRRRGRGTGAKHRPTAKASPAAEPDTVDSDTFATPQPAAAGAQYLESTQESVDSEPVAPSDEGTEDTGPATQSAAATATEPAEPAGADEGDGAPEEPEWTAADLAAGGWSTEDLRGAGWTDEQLVAIGWDLEANGPLAVPEQADAPVCAPEEAIESQVVEPEGRADVTDVTDVTDNPGTDDSEETEAPGESDSSEEVGPAEAESATEETAVDEDRVDEDRVDEDRVSGEEPSADTDPRPEDVEGPTGTAAETADPEDTDPGDPQDADEPAEGTDEPAGETEAAGDAASEGVVDVPAAPEEAAPVDSGTQSVEPVSVQPAAVPAPVVTAPVARDDFDFAFYDDPVGLETYDIEAPLAMRHAADTPASQPAPPSDPPLAPSSAAPGEETESPEQTEPDSPAADAAPDEAADEAGTDDGPVEDGPVEDGPVEDGTDEDGTDEDGTDEDGTDEPAGDEPAGDDESGEDGEGGSPAEPDPTPPNLPDAPTAAEPDAAQADVASQPKKRAPWFHRHDDKDDQVDPFWTSLAPPALSSAPEDTARAEELDITGSPPDRLGPDQHGPEQDRPAQDRPDQDRPDQDRPDEDGLGPPSTAAPLPAYVEYRPSNARRWLLGTLFLTAAVLAVVAVFHAVQDGSASSVITAVSVIVLACALWWGLISWAPRIITIANGTLEVAQGPNSERFDLTSHRTQIELGDDPRARSWTATIVRANGSRLVIRSAQVRPQQFTELVNSFRHAADNLNARTR